MIIDIPMMRFGAVRGRKLFGLIALLTPVVVLSRGTLVSLVHLALSNHEYSHILLVVPIVCGSLLAEYRTAAGNSSSDRVIGTLIAGAAVVMVFLTRLLPTGLKLTGDVFALVLAVWAAVVLVYGAHFFRASLFPMLFLLLLVPWPLIVVERLTVALQVGSTSAAYWLFKIFGVPVARNGFVLSLPSIDIEVATECSGIRSTVMLFVTALVLGDWYLHSAVRRTLLALAVFPIGILRNGLRIFILSVLGTYVNEGWLDGNLHHRGGVVFFVIGLALVAGLIWLLRRSDEKHSQSAQA